MVGAIGVADEWIDPSPTPDYWAQLVYDSNRQRIVALEYQSPDTKIWEYTTRWRQTPVPSALSQRRSPGLAYDHGREAVTLVGGYDSSTLHSDVWIYDGEWLQDPPAPAVFLPRSNPLLGYNGTLQALVILGGRGATSSLDDTWHYDGATWTEGPQGPGGAATLLADLGSGVNRVLAPGSSGWELWDYDGTWIQSVIPVPLRNSVIATIHDSHRGRSLIFEGPGSYGPLTRSWEFDGTTWTLGPLPGSSYLDAQKTVFDEHRGVSLMFGLCDFGCFPTGDPWRYDGLAWEPRPIRKVDVHVITFDRGRNRLVAITSDGATWEYDGSAWTGIVAAPFSYDISLTYDDRIRRVLAQSRSRLFLYDGNLWQPGPSLPPTVTGGPMTHDRRRGVTVLFDTDRVYELGAAGWSPGTPVPPKVPRRLWPAYFEYSPAHDAIVFGGSNSYQYDLDDTWFYDGNNWTRGPQFPSTLKSASATGNSDRFWVKTSTGEFEELTPAGWASAATPPYGYGSDITWDDRREVIASTPRAEYHLSSRPALSLGKGAGPSNDNVVAVWQPGGPELLSFTAYATGRWGTNVAAIDFNGGSFDELVTGPGPGTVFGPHVRGFSRQGVVPSVSFYAYGTLKYGVDAAGGIIDAKRADSILTAPGPGQVFGPQVRAWEETPSGVSAISGVSFFAFGGLRFGADVASGDVDDDATDEIVTAPGPGAGYAPTIRVFDYDDWRLTPTSGGTFDAFTSPTDGCHVAAGELDGMPGEDVVATPGAGPSQHARFRGFSLVPVQHLPDCDVTAFPSGYGGRVAAGDLNGDDREELLAAPGPDPTQPATVRTWDYPGALVELPLGFTAFPGTTYGVNPSHGFPVE